MSFLWSAITDSPLRVSITLNGGTATAYVYEDTDGDGVANNVQEVTLSDGDNTYDVPNLNKSGGNDYWVRIEGTPSGILSSEVIDVIELTI